MSGANPLAESRDIHALEALVEKYGTLAVVEMLVEIAEERGEDVAVTVLDDAAEELAESDEEGTSYESGE